MLICAPLASATFADEIRLDAIAGLWKFPEKAVWIEIGKDGRLFQCRMGGNEVFVSRGRFQAPDQLVWDSYWGAERVELTRSWLVVRGKTRPGVFARAHGPMSPECQKQHDA